MIIDRWTLDVPLAWDRWNVHLSVAAGLALLGGLYVYLGGLTSARRHVASFVGALVVLFLALNGPLHNLSDTYLFSAHMAQHLLLTLVFPPLLLYGTPAHVIRPLLRPRWVMAVGRFVTRLLAAALLFTGPIVIWHAPVLYEAALRDHNLHIAQHLVFLTTAVIMWWPVLSPVPDLPRASYGTQLLYLFALGLPMSLAGALITLADGVLYPFYVSAPRVWGLTPAADQQLGGLLMWVVGTIYLWVAASVVWFRWSAREESGDVEGAVPLEAYSTPPRPSPRGDARGGPL